jgi:hypothetical protein
VHPGILTKLGQLKVLEKRLLFLLSGYIGWFYIWGNDLLPLKKDIFIGKLKPDVSRCTFQPHLSFWHSTEVISIIVSPAP